MKKTIALLAVFILFPLFIFASGAKEEEDTSPTVIKYFTWLDDANIALVEAFNRSHDDIYVDANYIEERYYDSRILSYVQGEVDVDCFSLRRSSDMFSLYENNIIEPLTERIENGSPLSLLTSRYKNHIEYDGKILGLPFIRSSYYLYCNTRLGDIIGAISWDDLLSLDASFDLDSYPYAIMLSQSKEDMLSLDISEKLKDELIAIKTLYKENPKDLFISGNLNAIISSNYFINALLDAYNNGLLSEEDVNNYRVLPLPSSNKSSAVYGSTINNYIKASSEKKDAAFVFLTYLASSEASNILSAHYYIPASYDERVFENFAAIVPNDEDLNVILSDAEIYDANLNRYSNQFISVISEYAKEYIKGDIEIEDAIKNIEHYLRNIVRAGAV